MDFFKSVFSDDQDPPSSKSGPESPNKPELDENPDPKSPPNPDNNNNNSSSSDAGGADGGGWSFGGFMKTLSVKSESVLETYRRDLQEFGTGLKKEIEVAQGSLGTVSTVIDEFGNTVLKGTAQIISQGKEAILAVDQEFDSSSDNNNNSYNSGGQQQKRYSRFDSQVHAIQGDINTYCEHVDDLDDYNKWKSGFDLDTVSEEEIECLFEENSAMETIYKRVVPTTIDHETFWCRYFYRLFKLKQAEDLRVSLVKRAISREEDEDLSWDVDDDEDEEEEDENVNESEALLPKPKQPEDAKTVTEEAKVVNNELDEQTVKEESLQVDEEGKKVVSKTNVDSNDGSDANKEKVGIEMEKNDGMKKEDSRLKSNEKEKADKVESGEPSNGSDFSVIPSHPSVPEEEEDLGWDEIEDLSSMGEKKTTTQGASGSPNKADLRKRLSAAEEDEDLSWDIEDDDEPVKA